MLKSTLNKLGLIPQTTNSYSKRSYSQCGEDLIIDFIFSNLLGIKNPSYIDIGAHHPCKLSNTYYFYKKGSTGICIEPSPFHYNLIKKERKRDLCLNMGISDEKNKVLDFYMFNYPELNTFSQEIAEQNKLFASIEKVIQVNTIDINSLICDYLSGVSLDLISIDVEGFELNILKQLDFDKYRPKVFCIETINNSTENKNEELLKLFSSRNYIVYADTYINTIFVDKNLREKWQIK